MPERKKKFVRDKESKIDAIVRATVDLIEEKGYENFSVNDIPERAKLSIGTVYKYFPSGKVDILREILTRNTKKLMDIAILEDIDDSRFYEFWAEIIKSYVKGHREGIFHLASIEYSFGANPEFIEDIRPMIRAFYQQFVNSFRKLKMFETFTKKEILVRVGLVFAIMGMTTKSHIRRPIFKTDGMLIDYLKEIAKLTFTMKR